MALNLLMGGAMGASGPSGQATSGAAGASGQFGSQVQQTLGSASALAGPGMKLYGTYLQSLAQQESLIFQSRQLELQANEVQARSILNAGTIREQGKKFAARQKSGFAKSGVELKGSTLDVIEDTYFQTEKAARDQIREGEFRAGQLRAQQSNVRRELDYARKIGRAQQIGNIASMPGDLIGMIF